mmetsp:Transcript_95912/g.309349  ORF Transcript_95912/g.309349 Transcript_95912/m.309349 type:complete len:120 (+) Transcript_95912:581-940(+)
MGCSIALHLRPSSDLEEELRLEAGPGGDVGDLPYEQELNDRSNGRGGLFGLGVRILLAGWLLSSEHVAEKCCFRLFDHSRCLGIRPGSALDRAVRSGEPLPFMLVVRSKLKPEPTDLSL